MVYLRAYLLIYNGLNNRKLNEVKEGISLILLLNNISEIL